MRLAERVGERRWVLSLAPGILVQMPAQQETAALQRLATLQAEHGLLDRGLAEIDLREPDLTVRPRPPATAKASDRPAAVAHM